MRVNALDMATWVGLIKETFEKWQTDEVPRLGASLAYYAIFSMAPLLVIVIAIIGFVYQGNTVGDIQYQMESLMGLLLPRGRDHNRAG